MANNTSAAGIDGVPTLWFPVDHGLLSWSFDPAGATGTYTLAPAGTLYTVDLKVANSQTVSNIVYAVTTAGASLTANQCLVGIYQNGVLLGTSGNAATAWASAGAFTTALATPVPVQAGTVTVAFVYNGTTGITLAAGATSVLGNIGLAATQSRYGTANTGVTTALPATLGAKSASTHAVWVGLS